MSKAKSVAAEYTQSPTTRTKRVAMTTALFVGCMSSRDIGGGPSTSEQITDMGLPPGLTLPLSSTLLLSTTGISTMTGTRRRALVREGLALRVRFIAGRKVPGWRFV